MTTYDDIFDCFTDNFQVDSNLLPQTDEGKYRMINNAIKHYNNKMQDNIKCENTTETINRELDDDNLLVVAHYIKLIYLQNDLSDFLSIYSTFQKEIGFKDYKDQLQGRERQIEKLEDKIDELITNMEDDSIM